MEDIAAYQQFQTTIAHCQMCVDRGTPNAASIRQSVQMIEAFFQQQLLALTSEIDALYGIQVEINKQLRLLKTDCLFLQSAKQSEKQQQRITQIRNRLGLLNQYCEMALTTLKNV